MTLCGVLSIFFMLSMSSMVPIARRLGMCRQALAHRQLGGNGAERLRAFTRDLDDARALLEIIDPERRREPGGTRGGQHVIGARAIVAQRLRGILADEY